MVVYGLGLGLVLLWCTSGPWPGNKCATHAELRFCFLLVGKPPLASDLRHKCDPVAQHQNSPPSLRSATPQWECADALTAQCCKPKGWRLEENSRRERFSYKNARCKHLTKMATPMRASKRQPNKSWQANHGRPMQARFAVNICA